MKAGCHGLAPTQVSSPPERGLATNRDKNNKMKIAPNELLKTKGQK
jgi:hypothetical protein